MGADARQRCPVHELWDPVVNGKAPITIAFVPDTAGFGDTVAAARVFSLLAQRGRAATMRPASQLVPGDLRNGSTILIGKTAGALVPGLRFRVAVCILITRLRDRHSNRGQRRGT